MVEAIVDDADVAVEVTDELDTGILLVTDTDEEDDTAPGMH